MKIALILNFVFVLFAINNSNAQCLFTTNSVTDVSCFGGLDGSVDITPTNGQAPYTYTWSTGTTTVSADYMLTGLSTGTYDITVEDNLGCDTVLNVIINEPSQVVAFISNSTNVICNGDFNGSATLNVAGGTPGYSFLWENGEATQTAVGLPAGTYCPTVTDNNGCIAVACVTITEPSAISVSAGPDVMESCAGACDGTFTLSASGGSGALLFSIDGGLTFQPSATFTNLCSNQYVVMAQDANGCIGTDTINVQNPTLPIFTQSPTDTAICTGNITLTTASTGDIVQWLDSLGNIIALGDIFSMNVQQTTTIWYQTSSLELEPTAVGRALASGGSGYTSTSGRGITFDAHEFLRLESVAIDINGGPFSATIELEDGLGQIIATKNVNYPTSGVYVIDLDFDILPGTGYTLYMRNITGAAILSQTPFSNWAAYTYPFMALTGSTFAGSYPYFYEWRVSTLSSCLSNIDSITISTQQFDAYISNPVVMAGNNAHIFAGDSYPIQTFSSDPSNTVYNWTPAVSLNNATIPNPLAMPSTTTSYSLQAVHTISGCVADDTITIEVFNNAPTDTIYLEVAPDSSLNYCMPLAPFLNGVSGTSGPSNSPLSYGTYPFFHPYGCLIYNSNGTAPEVTDTIVWVNCDQLCDTTVFYVTTAACVWPGDTDDDGIANNFDLLPIGLHNGAIGNTRSNASINYTCQPSLNWNIGTTGNPLVDIKHIDTDGNATINPDDTNAIILNWAQTHQKNSSSFATGIDIYIDTTVTNPGDTISLPIVLGNGQAPSNGYGIAFTINYDPMGVDTNTVSIDFNNSWLGDIHTNMIGISKDFYYQGAVEVAMTRIDHTSASGGGPIGYINLTIKDDVLPKSAYVRLDFDISNVRFIDSTGTVIPTTSIPTQILVVDNANSVTKLHSTSNNISVYPNPTNDNLMVQSLGDRIESIYLYDITGNLILSKPSVEAFKTMINMGDLAPGMYLISIQSQSEIKNVKVIKH